MPGSSRDLPRKRRPFVRSFLKTSAAGFVAAKLAAGACLAAADEPRPDGSPASAEAPGYSQLTLSPDDTLFLARNLLAEGKTDAALVILSAIESSGAKNVDYTQVKFLTGMAHLSNEDYVAAREVFRGILSDNPNLLRVRLELARTLYLLEEDQAAAYHFRLVLANNENPAVRRNIENFLDQISRRQSFWVRVSLGLAPDSNANASTTDDVVQLFGFLPAEISPDAQRKSGLGARASVSANWFPHLSENWRGDINVTGHGVDYSGAEFDDFQIQSHAGVRKIEKCGYFGLVGTYARRWYGNESFYAAYGGRAEAYCRLAPKLALGGYISGALLDYDINEGREGPVLSASVNVDRALSSTQLASARVTVTREFAQFESLRSTDYALRLSYIREFGEGLTIETAPSIAFRPFDARDPLFDKTRNDQRYGASISVIKRDWSYKGWAPVLTYGYTRNHSNINIYDYSRHQGEIRFTRVF